ncbi:MAG: hypothetical protein GY929_20680 [Actinomycetia bacterium]|nr:hypothetical protein [Actinomycetes bacterium]
MSYRKFVPWNAAASVGWVTLVVMLGAVFGETVASVLDRLSLVVAGAVVVAVMVWVIVQRRHRRHRGH